jgi:Family of unknown function (DUF5331)
MSSFEELKADLKEKWLDYYEANHHWIEKLNDWTKTAHHGSYRPPAYVILGAISVLEPKIKNYLTPLCDIDSRGDSVVKALGLNFNPRIELEERETALTQDAEIIPLLPESNTDPDAEYLNQFRT